MGNLDQRMGELDDSIKSGMKVLVADALEIIAQEYETESEGLYSGIEVAEGLRGYGTRIREDATTT